MKAMNNDRLISPIFVLGAACVLGLLLMLVSNASAAPQALPPRPTPVPTPAPVKLRGGLISLQADATQPEHWTIVQWQDALGDWHDVDGWQGTFDQENRVIWWVAPKDLGTGPFRWTVYENQCGALLAASEPFDLPALGGNMVTVEVLLEPY